MALMTLPCGFMRREAIDCRFRFAKCSGTHLPCRPNDTLHVRLCDGRRRDAVREQHHGRFRRDSERAYVSAVDLIDVNGVAAESRVRLSRLRVRAIVPHVLVISLRRRGDPEPVTSLDSKCDQGVQA